MFGSVARGTAKKDSDIDLLILLPGDTLTWWQEKQIKSPLYDIEFETGYIVSPIVLPQVTWETKHKSTPFFESIQKEGIRL